MPGPDTATCAMASPDGRLFYPRTEAEASWYVVEHQAYPVEPDWFAWERVLTIEPSRINPAVYLPGSVL